METVEVAETFVSLQGESTYVGLPCFFVRLAGCNLRCRYCDTTMAQEKGVRRDVAGLAAERAASGAPLAEITGGEPLLQPGVTALAVALLAVSDGPLLVETNGSRDLSVLPVGTIAIMDIKCPGSGEVEATDWANLDRLRPDDQVKFVLVDRGDYEWARDVVSRSRLAVRCGAVLFSPVKGKLEPGALGAWILEDRLPVRLQLQLHKLLGIR